MSRLCVNWIAGAAIGVAGLIGSNVRADALESIREQLTVSVLDDEREHSDVARDLSDLGESVIPTLFDLYCGELSLLSENVDISRLNWWRDPGSFGSVYRDALANLPAKKVVEHLAQATKGDASVDIKCSAVRVLGELGTVESLDLLVRIAEGFGELALRYRSVRIPIQEALTATFQKAPKSIVALEEVLDECSDELIKIIATALPGSPSLEAAGVLKSLLGRNAGLDILIVDGLAKMLIERPWIFDGEVRSVLRPLLSSDNAGVRGQAIVALARIRDLESFSVLALLVDDDDPKTARTAAWALRRLAGSARGSNSREWLDWFGAQRDWWESNQRQFEIDLKSSESPIVMSTIRELTKLPIFSDEAALHLAALLEHESPDLVIATCTGLGQLGSRLVVPSLVKTLSSREATVQKAAAAALATLTGQNIPPSTEAWLKYLGNTPS